MKFGDIFCLKTTGELVFVLGVEEEAGTVTIRRPTMTREGIVHVSQTFFQAELETAEQHLRNEAKEMVLKADIQEEILTARNAGKAEKAVDLTIN